MGQLTDENPYGDRALDGMFTLFQDYKHSAWFTSPRACYFVPPSEFSKDHALESTDSPAVFKKCFYFYFLILFWGLGLLPLDSG